MYFKDVEWLLFLNAVSYSSFVKLKISSSDRLSDNLWQMYDALCNILSTLLVDQIYLYFNIHIPLTCHNHKRHLLIMATMTFFQIIDLILSVLT